MRQSVLLLFSLVFVLSCGGGGRSHSDLDVEDTDADSVSELTPLQLPAFEPPEKNVIVGRVVDRHGQGLEGVTVTLGALEASSNFDGFYYLSEVPAGER
ncbi:MAG: hypothetical protein RBU37_10135, partial [Myxococcota bacterium]|nr:hypothetical protein [Myxococcota bacterium]